MSDPSRGNGRRPAILLVAMSIALVREASAGPVFESYVQQRPAIADKVMPALLGALEDRGFTARPSAMLAKLGDHAPRPGIVDPRLTAVAIVRDVDDGFDAWLATDFNKAEVTLSRALGEANLNPALLVSDTKYRTLIMRGTIGLAMSRLRLNDTAGAERTMAQAIRSFPDQAVTRGRYGSEAEKLYKGVHKSLDAAGRGTLAIDVSNSQALIFVDGQIRGLGKASLSDMIAGEYHVFIQVPGSSGRQYVANVLASQETHVSVDWELDSALSASEAWVGFTFTTNSDRAKEAEFATRITKAISDSRAVVVVGIMLIQGKPAVIGTLYRVSDRVVVRSGVVVIDDDGKDAAKMRSLARFLTDGTATHDVEVVAAKVGAPVPEIGQVSTASAPNETPPRWSAWATLGGSAASIGASAYLLQLDGNPHLGLGLGLLGGGLALAGVSIYLFERGRPTTQPTVALFPGAHGGVAAAIGWQF